MSAIADIHFEVRVVYPPKLPKDYFMKWLREKISKNDIRLNFYFDDKNSNLTDFIKNEIYKWNPNSPVFISAQTGSGKNYFIQETLLPKLVDEYPNEKNLMLILSNRIALTRQTKLKFAERLVELTHNDEHLKTIKQFLTPEGVDNLYINFDVVTICSYHQMYSRKLLDSTEFKYIVCDECHFFTSDSTFNPDTDNMLSKIVHKGQNSIRIYMSATLETAFEPIIREEHKVIENYKKELEKGIEDYHNSPDYRIKMVSAVYGHNPQAQQELRNIAARANEIKDTSKAKHLNINFYCMARNYDYVKNIFSYRTIDKLAETVAKSNDKWIIFSNRTGNKIADVLKNKGVDVLFLSRNKLKNSKEREEYDYIIKNETPNKRVIVSTSLLDNGINLQNQNKKTNEKVLNIVIDTIDRVEFIQMLGRIRAGKNDEINLYITEQSIHELKKILLDDTEALIVRLSNDFLSLPEKQDLFKEYSDIFYFTHKENFSDYNFSDYNKCAVYFLVDRILNILNFIKNYQPNFYIEFVSSKLEALKSKVYDFYKNTDSKYKSWSKNIIDILESRNGDKLRNEYKQKALEDKLPEHLEVYDYVLQDSFIRYIFSVLIPQYYDRQAENYLNQFIQMLSNSEKNSYNTLVGYTEKKLSQKLSIYEKITLLFKNTENPMIQNFNPTVIKDIEKKSGKYRKYFEETPKDFLQIILQWIEKFDIEPINIDDKFEIVEDIGQLIISKAVRSENLKEYFRGKTGNELSVDETFLKEHGILKGSPEEIKVAEEYFQGQKLTDIVNKKNLKRNKEANKISINGTSYRLESYRGHTSDRNTYYLFEIVDDDLQNQDK